MKLKKNAVPIIKKKDNFARPYGYDKFGNLWDLKQAIEATPREWFLDPNQKIPMIGKFNAKIYSKHWAIKSNFEFKHNGKKFNTSNLNEESKEHIQAKHKIITDGFFLWNGYKIFIKETSEEFIFYDGRNFRADIKASMMDGTPIFVEVVKTSDISEGKESFINKNELNTFIIYIDKDGNQINEKFNIIGNKEIKQITEQVQDGEGKIAEASNQIEEYNNRIRKTQREFKTPRRTDFQEPIRGRLKESFEKIEQLEREYKKFKREYKQLEGRPESGIRETIREIENVKSKFEKINKNRINSRKKTRGYFNQIKSIQIKVSEPNKARRRYNETEREYKSLQEAFNKASKRCNLEWYTPKWIGGNTKDKINDLKYWTS